MSPPRIRRLPHHVADAIAAGEVIERPASVVKELVENSLDSGATRITVAVRSAGFTQIEVIDDGSGIDAADLTLAVTPHATSKLRDVAGLETVSTLGFRGEALASIAAVSDLRIVTRAANAAHGAELHARAGEIVSCTAAAAPAGTRVTVAELFATTPARLRFMRGERAENAAIRRVAGDIALCRADVALTLLIDDAEALRTSGSGVLEECLRMVFGSSATGLVGVEAPGDIAVRGLLSPPTAHHGARGGLVTVVNGRRVHNRSLTVAVEEAYRGLLPAGRHPFGVVLLSLDPSAVDVNVHPTKREVRFHDDRAVFATVQRACWAALREDRVDVPRLRVDLAPDVAPAATAADASSLTFEDAPEPEPDGVELRSLGPLTVLGQANSEWIVAAGPRSVIVIDPHAAHEKVLYTRLRSRRTQNATTMQQLLFPAVITLTPARWQAFADHGDVLSRFGFAAEEFGAATIRCTAVPLEAGPHEPELLLTEVLDALAAGGTADRVEHRMAALIACHAAVRFGDPLGPAEQRSIVDELLTTPGGSTCPHGRPTAVVLDEAMLRRAFHRPPG